MRINLSLFILIYISPDFSNIFSKMAMIIKKRRSRRISAEKDPQKEGVFKGLVNILQKAGVEVRREELKRGHGWKVSSGACRLQEARKVFVDRMLPQDDQISFLIDQILELNISPLKEDINELPDVVKNQLARGKSNAESEAA